MNPDPESLFQYLDQTRQLYGNHLLLGIGGTGLLGPGEPSGRVLGEPAGLMTVHRPEPS